MHHKSAIVTRQSVCESYRNKWHGECLLGLANVYIQHIQDPVLHRMYYWVVRFVANQMEYIPYRMSALHDDVIKWKYFQRHWPFVRGLHRSPVNFLHKGQWRGALMFSLICVWINDWVNNREAGDLRRHRAHYDVIVMYAHCFGVVISSFPSDQFDLFTQSCVTRTESIILPQCQESKLKGYG